MNVKISDVYKVNIIDQENEGFGVGKIDNFIVFVENGLKGDYGDVKITEIKKNYARGKMISFDVFSDERTCPPCPYYEDCGGCNLQHQLYEFQLSFKELKVKKALEHIGKLNNVVINKIISGSDYYYRNKITLRIERERLGFYKHSTNEIVEIDECIICHKEINTAIKVVKEFIKEHSHHNLDLLMIRYSEDKNELLMSFVGDKFKLEQELVTHLTSKLNNIKTININDKTIYGDGYLVDNIFSLKYKISPLSFFQINSEMMKKIYSKVIEYADLSKEDTVLDLYCGIGTISLLLAHYSKKVIGIEVVEDAVRDAKENALNNKVRNTEFILGKVENSLNKLINEEIDVIVVDPPRSGMDKKALNSIVKINPRKIIYVSCNPVTLARDLRYLVDNEYEIEKVTPFDMFPETGHVECVVKLNNKGVS